jgi:hypothetical protein
MAKTAGLVFEKTDKSITIQAGQLFDMGGFQTERKQPQ